MGIDYLPMATIEHRRLYRLSTWLVVSAYSFDSSCSGFVQGIYSGCSIVAVATSASVE